MRKLSPLACVVRSLHLQTDQRRLLRSIPESEWPRLLRLTDEARLTLPLAIRCADELPASVRARVEENLASNLRRHARLVGDWKEIAAALTMRGVEFIALKGLTHWPFYSADPAHRPQYDFDIYCPEKFIKGAQDAASSLGYEPTAASTGPAPDHVPAMIRRTGFTWRGDYFDPALPLSVEFHHRFWNPGRESFSVRDPVGFWARRTMREVDGIMVPALHHVDCLSFATWHLVRHLLRGNLRIFHAYEIACFLNETSGDDGFWKDWTAVAPDTDRSAEAIAFRLASDWFGCRLHPSARASIERLPARVDRWFRLFGDSPLLAQERLNKDELFLHLALVGKRSDRVRIAAQRIFPRNPPRVTLDAHSQAVGKTLEAKRAAFRVRFLLGRAARHTRALWPVLRGSLRWWLAP